jgi:hypothetical protein
MPVWQVVVLLNLALAVGVGAGYGAWGHRAAALERAVDDAEGRAERLERERQACTAGARADEQQWEGRGILRAAYPQLLVITHEEIRGLLPARTTGFRPASPVTAGSARVGDAIRFSVRGTSADDAVLVALGPW